MLSIASAQVDLLAQAALRDFEQRVWTHLRDSFPEECSRMGDNYVRDEIRYGIRRAHVHGFDSELNTVRYINLMFALGGDFDSDPNMTSLIFIIRERTPADPTERMDRLYGAAMQILSEAAQVD